MWTWHLCDLCHAGLYWASEIVEVSNEQMRALMLLRPLHLASLSMTCVLRVIQPCQFTSQARHGLGECPSQGCGPTDAPDWPLGAVGAVRCAGLGPQGLCRSTSPAGYTVASKLTCAAAWLLAVAHQPLQVRVVAMRGSASQRPGQPQQGSVLAAAKQVSYSS